MYLLALLLLIPGSLFAADAIPSADPGWISVTPPLLAILLALLLKRVIPALFLGLWLGAWAVNGMTLEGLWTGLLDSFQVYVLNALADKDHASIILFSLMVGGMVGIISRNGGMRGIVNRIVSWADSARRASTATAVMGLAIFFDDYANTLVVGNTMRPITDKLKVSREKLAYLVDSTAAPVACLALVTTWIGYEVGLIDAALENIAEINTPAYVVFLQTLPYSFYPILALFFVFLVCLSGRDFGPMLKAELRARHRGEVLAAGTGSGSNHLGEEIRARRNKPHRAINALLPVMMLVGGVLGGLYVTGEGNSVREIIGSADSYKSLMWGSLLGVLCAALLSLGQGILDLEQTVEAWFNGLKSMMYAMIILILAWSLSAITQNLGTADFLVSILGDTLAPQILPTLVFLLAAATAFATGSSWSTMGILLPLVVPLCWALLQANGIADAEHMHLLFSTVASVLAGSVWGDHCSPISDTTIMSSMASGCDHIEHVRTQLPYAMLVGSVCIALGVLPTAYGLPWWSSYLLGFAVLITAMRILGKPVPEYDPDAGSQVESTAAQ